MRNLVSIQQNLEVVTQCTSSLPVSNLLKSSQIPVGEKKQANKQAKTNKQKNPKQKQKEKYPYMIL